MTALSGDGFLVGTATPTARVCGRMCCGISEAAEAKRLLPAGLHLIGYYSSTCKDKAELQQFVQGSALRATLGSAVGQPIFALVGDGSPDAPPPIFFAGYQLTEVAAADEVMPATADVAVAALHATHLALRATPLVHLNVHHGNDQKRWAADLNAAVDELCASILQADKCFAFPEARHMGVVGLDADPKTRAAPFVGEARPCGALTPNAEAAGAATATGDDEDDEADDDEDDDGGEGEVAGRGGGGGGGGKKGGKKGGGGGGKKGKKGGGGGKKGGKKGGGGGGGAGATDEGNAASAADGADAPLPEGCPLSVQLLWPQSAPAARASPTRHAAPRMDIEPSGSSSTAASSLLAIPLQLDCVAYCARDEPLASALRTLQQALADQVQGLAAVLLEAAPTAALAAQHSTKACTFRLLPCTSFAPQPAGGPPREPAIPMRMRHSPVACTAHPHALTRPSRPPAPCPRRRLSRAHDGIRAAQRMRRRRGARAGAAREGA